MFHETRGARVARLMGALMLVACDARPSNQPQAEESAAANPAAAPSIDSARNETSIDRTTLMGAWSTDGESFALAIEEGVILYEFDMKEHPYRLEGDTIIVDFQDPTLGVQKKLVLKLTADTLVLRDVEYGVSDTLIRVRQ